MIDNKYKAKKRKEEALRGKAKTLLERLGGVLAANEYFEPEFGAQQLEVLEEDTLECVMTELKNTKALELLFNAGIFRCQASDIVLHFLDTDNAKEFSINTVVPKTVKEKAKKIDLNKFKYSK